MAKQVINIGASPNDKTGDPLRTAFTKINDNFTELYTISVSADETLTTLTPNGVFDAYEITAQASALSIANPSTDYANFDGFILRIYSAGAQTITFENKYRAQGTALPSATTSGKVMVFTFLRDSGTDKYDVKFSIEV